MSQIKALSRLNGQRNDTFVQALRVLINTWLADNRIGYASPSSGEEIAIIRRYNESESVTLNQSTEKNINVDISFDNLITQVPSHLINIISHRTWIKFVFEFCKSAAVG